MEARRSSVGLVLVQGVLLTLCAASLLVFASWTLGYNGLGLVADRMPDRLMEANAQVHEPVLVDGPAGIATTAAANTVIGTRAPLTVEYGDGTAEFFGNQADLSFLGPTRTQHAAWVAVRALPALGLSMIWWVLFRIVHDVRRRLGFTRQIALRIRIIGGLVLLGVPLLQLAGWAVARWLIETSTAAGIAHAPRLHVDVWPFAIGLVIVVMASVWRETVRMREDLEGLV